jgi:hypothetical protein
MTSPTSEDQPSPAADGGWAICCSGGGIRSAVYCLGALQSLEATHFLDKTKLILGVSGGSHIAASRALVAHGLEQDTGKAGSTGAPPYTPGTPEEQHLLNNAKHLAADAITLPATVLMLLFGVAITMLLILTPLFAVAHAWGWLLRSQGVLTPPGAAQSTHWTVSLTATWWNLPVLAATYALGFFLVWWVSLSPGPDGTEPRSRGPFRTLNWALLVTLVLATAMLAVPAAIAWLSGPHSGTLKAVLDNLGFASGARWTPAALTGFVVAVVAISQSAQKYLAKYDLLSAPAAAQTADAPPGFLRTVTGYLRGLLLPWLASILVLLAGFIAVLRWVKDGAAAGFTWDQVWQVIGALAIMLVTRALADVNRISLHDFYRWRLASIYAVIRDTGNKQYGKPAPFGTKDFPGALLSQLTGQRPELVICATANMNAHREVSPGRGGMSFSLDPDHATLRGPVPGESVQARTADYEALIGRRHFTLFDVSALSGTALSPLIGAATRQVYRIMFTATDLRLGVWLPHPALVAAARQELERQQESGNRADRWWHAVWLLLRYMLPHPLWRLRDERLGGLEARLWAYVLKLRLNRTRSQQFFGGLMYHALQPTLGILYAEAVGHTSYRGTWMCVTDGGQYDNLGLVEAIQRGATHILLLDATGDKPGTWSTLGGAIALARADAGVQIDLDPTTMVRGGRDLAPSQVVSPWAYGRFYRPQQVASQLGDIWMCKPGWWTDAPWDVVAYAKRHPSYPSGSSLEQPQLKDFTDFEAYRQLGVATIVDVAKHWTAAPKHAPTLGVERTIVRDSPGSAETAI